MSLDRFYNKSPVFAQNIACSVYGYLERRKRFSAEFYRLLGELKNSDYFDRDQIQSYSNAKLAKSLNCALEKSEYYQNICLLYTSPSPRDKRQSRMPSSA